MTAQKKHVLFIVLFIFLLVANVFSQNAAFSDEEILCERLSEIKELPRKSGVDAVYDSLISADQKVVPCLIEKITDTAIMPDPRCPRITSETRIGDVAYFVLTKILNIGFVEMFPPEMQEKYKTEGVYAYHEYIEQKDHRKKLQSDLREWYRQNQKLKTAENF